LVGQWIEEAKSKLEDPGLVFPYHGQGRKRDANILSRNSIVVTTYQVIASDATRRAKKAGKDYRPPLEQVQWWRIICDEGHSLREGQTQRSKAVLSLVADHKWLVSGKLMRCFHSRSIGMLLTSLSGTPLDTSVSDLANQFKFLGVEHADEIIRSVDWSSGRSGRQQISNHTLQNGKLQFLLGGIMMRNSQKQKYRGTETTLMSLPRKVSNLMKRVFVRRDI
jgi:hypothetical protein